MRAKGVFFELSESLSTDENRQTAHPTKANENERSLAL